MATRRGKASTVEEPLEETGQSSEEEEETEEKKERPTDQEVKDKQEAELEADRQARRARLWPDRQVDVEEA